LKSSSEKPKRGGAMKTKVEKVLKRAGRNFTEKLIAVRKGEITETENEESTVKKGTE
jgi:hypothetical protein